MPVLYVEVRLLVDCPEFARLVVNISRQQEDFVSVCVTAVDISEYTTNDQRIRFKSGNCDPSALDDLVHVLRGDTSLFGVHSNF